MSVFTLANQVFQDGQNLSLFSHGLNQVLIFIKLLIALFGTLAIFVGAILAIYRYGLYRLTHRAITPNNIRLDLANSIILGLEFFIAADVIETTIAADFSSLAILGILVIIRTILNFSMEREIKNLSLTNAQNQLSP